LEGEIIWNYFKRRKSVHLGLPNGIGSQNLGNCGNFFECEGCVGVERRKNRIGRKIRT
jgi:hypothetical protein